MEKLARLSAYLEERSLDAVWFARPAGFAWLTGGSNVVDRSAEAGVAAAGYDGETVTILTSEIEAERIEQEELPDVTDYVVEKFPWYEDYLPSALASRCGSDERVAADLSLPRCEELNLVDLTSPLTDLDRERYRELGRETAKAVETICNDLSPQDTEREVAAALTAALRRQGIEAPVTLAGGADRVSRYRHFTPQAEPLGQYAIVSVTAERHGLHASCSRTVAFDPPAWVEERHTSAARIDATAIAVTRALTEEDGRAKDVFEAITEAYRAVGWSEEWQRHHQGGAAGFAGREWVATPEAGAPVKPGMAYAWNPTVRGTKSEDTVLIDGGIERLTATESWPTEAVRTVDTRVTGTEMTIERPSIYYPENN